MRTNSFTLMATQKNDIETSIPTMVKNPKSCYLKPPWPHFTKPSSTQPLLQTTYKGPDDLSFMIKTFLASTM